MPSVSGKRVLLLGAETVRGRECAAALAEAGASLALVSAAADAEAAFAAQRLARRLGAPVNQAINAENESAVRVMVRQVAKALGGLDACVDATGNDEAGRFLEALGCREMARSGGGVFITAGEEADIVAAVAGEAS